MEGDGEAVHLVLHAREELKQLTVEGYGHRDGGIAKKHLAGAVAIVFGQTGDGDLQAETVFDDLANGFHLPDSTVGDDQIGEFFAFFGQSRVAALDNFAHGGIIVRSHHGFNMEFAVEFLGRLEFLEDHAGGHGVFARDVGVVEEFDAHR